ncbi:tetratricopeptide repeat protein [candidate division KSB1 bacterium]|nr:tetratricopeptide repeat protein [candidate division KSB1 bacterium]
MIHTHSHPSALVVKLIGLLLLLLLIDGCGYYTAFTSYYNIYYNVKRRFTEAERDYLGRSTPASTSPSRAGSPPSASGGRSTPALGGAEKYRKVIESGSKLLEFYPKSRWIDDTLLLMGISYYRMSDYARAERKFAELATLFPTSEHLPAAKIWNARVLAEQKRDDEAIADLNASLPLLRHVADRAAVEELLGDLYRKREEWPAAADHYSAAAAQARGVTLANALYELGMCRFQLQDYARARDAFVQAGPRQLDRDRAFACELHLSRCQIAAGEYEQAERTLHRLRGSGRFAAFAPQIGLELADLAIQQGRVEDGMAQLQRIIEVETDRPTRARAFYRLGTIHRDLLADLPTAKSLMDSALAGGAAREISDSARSAVDQISRGLSSLDLIKSLQDSVAKLSELRTTALERPAVPRTEEVPVRLEESPPVDSDSAIVVDTTSVATSDSMVAPVDSVSLPEPERKSPAAFAADSLLRSLEAADSLQKAERQALADTSRSGPATAAAPKLDAQQLDSLLVLTRRQLQRAYLRAGEFYSYTLDEPDSARHYFAKAAASAADPLSYWKGNLQLARDAAADSVLDDQRVQDYYRAVLESDSVPLDAANEARVALGLAPEFIPESEQALLFGQAEQWLLDSTLDIEQALEAYRRVVALDTTTPLARRALFAQFMIYDEPVRGPHLPDSAVAIANQILSMFPDQGSRDLFERRVQPDDSNSVFYLTEADLQKKYMPIASAASIEEAPSESGWPPPEGSLRGRRFH